jgi:hypothetical protein
MTQYPQSSHHTPCLALLDSTHVPFIVVDRLESTTVAAAGRWSAGTITSRLSGASTEIHSQLAAINLLASKRCKATLRTFDIDEVCMCETSWLASASVNGYSDINDISNITEEPVEVGIGHFKGKIANE